MRVMRRESTRIIDLAESEACLDDRAARVVAVVCGDDDIAIGVDFGAIWSDAIVTSLTTRAHDDAHREVVVGFAVRYALTVGEMLRAFCEREPLSIVFETDHLDSLGRLTACDCAEPLACYFLSLTDLYLVDDGSDAFVAFGLDASITERAIDVVDDLLW